MKVNPLLLIVLPMVLLATGASAENVAGLPLHIQSLDEGVIRVWVGDHISSTATVGIATEDGLVVIDTSGVPVVDRGLRRVIARELGRDDFKILINTHEHGDHTGGNAVYGDCTIIGHELVAAGMQRIEAGRPRTIEWLEARIGEMETEVAQLQADDPAAGPSKESLTFNRLMLECARKGEALVPPTWTFSDRMVLSMGDTTFELSYIGGMHSASDIAIFVPERGLMMTGDTMADVWLTDMPGCLGSFRARPGIHHDFPLLLTNWNALIERKDEIKAFIPGHWNGELSYEGFASRVEYVETLWAGVNEAAGNGGDLNSLLADYTLASRFTSLVDSPGCDNANNATTIAEMWNCLTDQQCAAAALYRLYRDGADASDVAQIMAQIDAESPTHYFLESQLNAFGYRLLQSEMAEQATAMFKLNVDLNPESWNVYDSYGEALFALGESETALAMYEKSLELNPESPTGLEMVERIRSGAAIN